MDRIKYKILDILTKLYIMIVFIPPILPHVGWSAQFTVTIIFKLLLRVAKERGGHEIGLCAPAWS